MLEITAELQKHAETLDERIAVLNLPAANFCEKRSELVEVAGKLERACRSCITEGVKAASRMSLEQIKRTIDYFAQNYGTMYITINGRGSPFHPLLKAETMGKISYAAEKGIKSYVFTAGDNLDEITCRELADHKASVIISLYGNRFIDADFFEGQEYSSASKPLQNQQEVAGNLRRLLRAYHESPHQPVEGITRIGMNYVVSESDLADNGTKLKALKEAANKAGLFFICNTPFEKNGDKGAQARLEARAREYSNFHLRHSTAIGEQCQMGAGSGVTVDYDGTLLRCPYMQTSQGQGKFQELSETECQKVLAEYQADRTFPCVMRKHQK